jgi:phage tail-like protein
MRVLFAAFLLFTALPAMARPIGVSEEGIKRVEDISFTLGERGIGLREDVSTSQWSPSAPRSLALEIEGRPAGELTSAEGRSYSEYKDGDDPITLRKVGKAKYKNIVLKRGMVNDLSLLEWYRRTAAGSAETKTISVIFVDRSGAEMRLNFYDSYPVRWKAPELNAKREIVSEETIELTFERMEVK